MGDNLWRKSIGVVGMMLLAFVFVFSQAAWPGQGQQPKEKANTPQSAAAQPAVEKQVPAAATAKPQTAEVQGEASKKVVAEQKPSGGSQEGIKVHGHWTIEVRNPDGAMVRHVEFENSVDPGYSYTESVAGQPVTVQITGGAAYLAALLSGKAAAPTWRIVLGGPAGLSSPFNPTNAPCVDPVNSVAQCVILPPPTLGNVCASSAAAGVNCDLTVSALGTSPALTAIQLTGSVQASQNGQIATVETTISNPCTNLTAAQCAMANEFTVTNGIELGGYSFTSSTNFTGAPISVSAGQTIAVTVIISFS